MDPRKFICSTQVHTSLLDVDETAYLELERMLEDEVRKHIPGYLISPTREELKKEREQADAARAQQLSTLNGCKLEMLSLSPRDIIKCGLDSFSPYAYVSLPTYLQSAVDKLSEDDQYSFDNFEQEYQERMESEGYSCIEDMKQSIK